MYRIFTALLFLNSFVFAETNPPNKPKIVGQNSVATLEDNPVDISVNDLVIEYEHPDEEASDPKLIVNRGDHYSVSGTTIMPEVNYAGMLSVPVQVDNHGEKSNKYDLQVSVKEVNDPPVITAQAHALQTQEEQSLTITLADLVVSDSDNVYPDDFTLTVYAGANYTVSGATITPTADFYGALTVTVSVSDGTDNSNNFDLTIDVTNVNDAPTITAQQPLAINEDQTLGFDLNDLTVSDVDNSYPTGFSLFLSEGDNYTVSGNTITPSQNFSGSITVPLSVNDGSANSNIFNVTITVNAVNDAPTITAQSSLTTNEDHSISISLSDFTIVDPDNSASDFSLSFQPGSNYSLSGSTVMPDNNFYGTLSVPVTVNDGSANSNVFNAEIVVSPVNDAPSITGQSALQTSESQAITLTLADLSVTDIDNTYPDDFTLIVQSGSNYTFSGTTITPNTNFNGTLSVPVYVYDGTSNSNSYNVQITVTNVNSPPVITGQSTLQTNEDQSITLSLADLTVTDDDNTYPTGFSMAVQSGSNYSVSGLTITPAPDYNGTLTVPVTVNDGAAESNTFSLTITVDPQNDPPSITNQQSLATDEDTPLTLVLNDLVVQDIDNSFPTGFTLAVSSGTNYAVSGTTITPSQNFNGTLTVPVTVSDGASQSNVFNLSVAVNAVNDAPVITAQKSLSTNEDASLAITLSDLTVTDVDNTYPSGFSLVVGQGDHYTVSGNTITPASNFYGNLSVSVTVSDGIANSAPYSLTIVVNNVDDAPVITGQTSLSTNEETAIELTLGDLIATDIDNTFPNNFTLTVGEGLNYTVSGTTITPVLDFNGELTVPVVVNDGVTNSASFNLKVTVAAVNDAPVITGQTDLSTEEETPVEISFSNLKVTDVDNTYPQGFTMTISAGTNYTVSGNTVTPAENFAGDLSVAVTVSDGTSPSAPFNLRISVVGENDPPVITGQTALTISEDQAFVITLANLTVTDTDNTYPGGFSITPANGDNYVVSEGKIVPAPNFNGTLTIPTTVSDGINSSNTFNVVVTVTPVNDPPVITAQEEISIYKNKTLVLDLSKLQVTDPDNNYPDDFSLTIQNGEHYLFFDNTITPSQDFIGELSIPVTVSDGALISNVFILKVNVLQPPNVVPVITSQVTLTTYENQSLELQLAHLVVVDPDNKYPDDFTLIVNTGEHFTLSGNTVIPEKDFSGPLAVPVMVKDKESTSNVFSLRIDVLPVADVPLISSQAFLRINEDDSLTIGFSDLQVIDPDDDYPSGFTITILDGEHYSIKGLMVKPDPDYAGYLSVPATVNDGVNTSAPYQLLILVEPMDDAPELSYDGDAETLFYAVGKEALKVFEKLVIHDVDDDSLAFAEVTIPGAVYQPGFDSLAIEQIPDIRSVFDSGQGLLLLFGKAPVTAYEQLIRSVTYEFSGTLQNTSDDAKVINVTVSDGKNESSLYARTISFSRQSLVLDIPTGFTPNGDGTNDTWNIKGTAGNESFSDAVIRVYNRQGALVFETKGFETEWDGKLNGILLPADAYFYTIDLNGVDMRSRYHGVISILR